MDAAPPPHMRWRLGTSSSVGKRVRVRKSRKVVGAGVKGSGRRRGRIKGKGGTSAGGSPAWSPSGDPRWKEGGCEDSGMAGEKVRGFKMGTAVDGAGAGTGLRCQRGGARRGSSGRDLGKEQKLGP